MDLLEGGECSIHNLLDHNRKSLFEITIPVKGNKATGALEAYRAQLVHKFIIDLVAVFAEGSAQGHEGVITLLWEKSGNLIIMTDRIEGFRIDWGGNA